MAMNFLDFELTMTERPMVFGTKLWCGFPLAEPYFQRKISVFNIKGEAKKLKTEPECLILI